MDGLGTQGRIIGGKQMTEQNELQAGIYLSEHQMNNMTMERIVVSNPAIIKILEVVHLTDEEQLDAVQLLVDRTPDWLELDEDEDVNEQLQIAKIKTVLTQETVLKYLALEGVIREKCDTVQVGIDEEGSIVVEAYYVQLNREQRRAVDKSMTEEQKKQMVQAVNALGEDNIVDLAKKKFEKLQKAGKIKDGKVQR
jgi:hypothetical protein